MDIVMTSGPTRPQKLAVVTVADVKASLRITNAAQDTLLERYIVAAYNMLSGIDGIIGHAPILEEAFTYYLPATSGAIELPARPFRALTGFTYMDADSVYQPIDAALYRQSTDGLFQRITRLPGTPYPSAGVVGDPRGYRIQFTAGFAAVGAPDDVPEEIKLAILLLVGHFYENREQTFADNRISEVSREIKWGCIQVLGKYVIYKDHS